MIKFMRPKQQESEMADNGKQQVQRSRYLAQIDHLRAIKKHMTAYMDLNSMDNFDMQKGVDFVEHRLTALASAVEEIGGVVEQESVEEQIKDYLPKALHREPQQ